MDEKPPFDIPAPDPGPQKPGKKAERENQAMAFDFDLGSKNTENKLNKMNRRDKMDGHLHLVLVILIYFVAALLALMLFALAISMVFEGFWLSDDRVQELQEFLFTGGVGAGLATMAQMRLGLERGNDEDK